MSCRTYGMDRHPYLLSYAFAVSLILDCEDRAGLTQMDALSEKACEWMRTKNITKVIMNPPYATNAHPIEILKNVLTSVNPGTKCAFILPDTKLEKPLKNRQILKYGVLEKIVKLPSRTFSGVSDVSVFIFSAGQNREQGKIFTCGEMVRFMAGIHAEKPEQMKTFNWSSYHFDEERSSDTEYVFIRTEIPGKEKH